MRTNIDIDDALLASVMQITGQSTKKGAVEEALRRLVQHHERKAALEELRGMGWDGDLDAIRGPHADELPENKEYFEKHADELERAKALHDT